MGAGKSLEIFRIADNYQRQNKKVLCFVPEIVGEIKSRVGITTPSIVINNDTDIIKILQDNLPLHCLLIDEAQFLNKKQILQLVTIVDTYDIPVICYGLKNDFRNALFEGSKYLLLYADKIQEVKTTCYFCNKKATMVLRIKDDKPIYKGEQIQIERKGDTDYLPVCRKHWFNPNNVMLNLKTE